MSTVGSSVSVTSPEVYALSHAVAANPPDGAITLTNASDGTVHAEWQCGGRTASIGGAQVVTLRPKP